MANKLILWIIKLFAIFVFLFFITYLRNFIHFPIILISFIVVPIVYAIWQYKPSSQNDQNTPSK